jgi:hypothetical protein
MRITRPIMDAFRLVFEGRLSKNIAHIMSEKPYTNMARKNSSVLVSIVTLVFLQIYIEKKD